jgi:transposase
MWTPTTRKQHIRKTDRYQTDVTDEEWFVIEPHLPATKTMGRPRAWPMREIINGIFLCDAIWLYMAFAAERFAAVEHDLSLVCEVS